MNTTVVYYFADPSFEWDMSAAVNSLKERGIRVVKGDNADELLFLLQVGRPAAVIYTLAASDSMSQANYQMVSRRALDLLVPVIAIGPDNPRDGLMLIAPVGRRTVEQHLPLHDLASTIEKFAANPPSTPSRPPAAVDEKTLGKGKTILNWQAAEQAEAALKQQRDVDAPAALQPVAADKKTQRMIDASLLAGGTPLQSRPPEPVQVPSTKKTVQMAGLGSPSKPPDIAPSAGSVPPVPDLEISATPTPAPTSTTGSIPPRRTNWLVVVALGTVVLLAVAAIVYFAILPTGSAPQPVPRPAAPVGIATGAPVPRPTPQPRPVPIPAPVAPPAPEPETSPPAPAPAPVPAPSQPAPEPTPVPALPQPAPEPAPAPAPPQPTPEPAPVPAPPQPAPGPISPPAPAPAPPAPAIAEGDEQPFPGHFRPASATFWFSDEVDGIAAVDQIKRRGSAARVTIVGHPTRDEVAAGQGALGLSRAWAVEKYLVRNGVDPSVLTPMRGRAVEPRDDLDERGWAQNRWVGLIFE